MKWFGMSNCGDGELGALVGGDDDDGGASCGGGEYIGEFRGEYNCGGDGERNDIGKDDGPVGKAVLEARAIIECLNWAWQEGFRDLEVQSDAKNVVKWIHEGPLGRGPIRHLIEEAQQWLNGEWRVSIQAVYREQNKVADCLAKFGAKQEDGRKTVDLCPIGSEDAFLDDLAHVTSARRVVELAS
ncbi:uncharacterized protein LOC116033158 [Ipomoea triloba]|uniref:uncharacterized protein LOC116033158 n=1 Tax=Ipomoea triloba TaxID=35885 RepID=UPI00125E63C8|nr:uncharacterized protein LOC116033158 [Ipomoea triloba]